jgi:hypothetical protein
VNHGPVNAFRLLWTLRGKYVTLLKPPVSGLLILDFANFRVTHSQILGSVGLLVIIIAVAIDPFTQQVIQYYEITSPSAVASNATLPRTSVYNIAGLHTGAGLSTLDNPMIGAIQAGFWTPGTASYAVSANKCTTGNCTFTEPYRSVGICNACSDLTASISQKCDSIISLCNYTLPTGSSLSLDQQWMAGYNNWGTTVPGYFGAREFIWSNGTLPGKNFTCRGTTCPVSAAGCYLYPCINTYTASISNGILDESITSSIPLTSSGAGCYTNLRKDCLTPTDWAALSTQGVSHNTDPGSDYIFYCNDSTHLYDSSDYPDPTGPRFTDACVYDFDVESYYSMQGFWSPVGSISPNVFLTGTLTGDVPVEAVGDASELLYLYDYGNMTYANVTAAYSGMANTMTARMRIGMIGSNYSAPAQGTIYYLQTLIRVEWAWLALALALVILTLLFIIAVIIHTSLNGRKPLGEAFSLSLLFTGVAGDVNSQIPGMLPGTSFVRKAWRRLIGAKEPVEQKNVDEVQIQMKEMDDGGWRLVKVDVTGRRPVKPPAMPEATPLLNSEGQSIRSTT